MFLGDSGAEWLQALIAQYAHVGPRKSADFWRISDYATVALRPDDNLALRKVMDHQGHRPEAVHPLITESLERGCGLAELHSEIVAAALGDAGKVAAILNSQDLSAHDKVEAVAAIALIVDPARLASELEADSTHAADDEGEEAVETAGAARPIEMLTMVGSKGLSAHHVVVLGCDNVNMNRTSRLTFFVGMTRARKSLHLLASAKAGGGSTPHDFLLELPEELCEFLIHKMDGDESLSKDAFSERFATWSRAMAARTRGAARRGRGR